MWNWKVYQFHDTSNTAYIKQKHYLDDSGYLRHDAGNLAPFLFRLSVEKPEYYRRIVDTIPALRPFFDDFVLIPNHDGKNILLNWHERKSDMLFGPHQLSDGTLRLMALVTLLLQPELPSVIIIDEPELGLHPYAITLLAGLLKNASEQSQVIVSTQSSNLVDRI